MPEVSSSSLSEVWVEATKLASNSENREVRALIATVTDLADGVIKEDAEVRERLDHSLRANDMACVETVAGTIFPRSLWNPSSPRSSLFARYTRIFPRVKRDPKNRRGTYFQRMIGYPSLDKGNFNQLEQVISTYVGGNHRRSALQASIIIPNIDLNDARVLGFPCMHQVAFLPETKNQTIRVVGFYPMQYLYERAYGNYLGLIRLGQFMAKEMNLQLEAMSCVSVVAKLEVSKTVIAQVIK
jgi:hypothetical protein